MIQRPRIRYLNYDKINANILLSILNKDYIWLRYSYMRSTERANDVVVASF